MSDTDPLSTAPDSLVRGGQKLALDGETKQSLTSLDAESHLAGASWAPGYDEPATVSYAFRASGTVPDPDSHGFSQFTTVQMAAAQQALTAWSDIANITFVRADDGSGYSNNATILFGDYASGPSAGFTYLPASRNPASSSGDVWINSSLPYNVTPTRLNYGGEVLVHEIGHSIGMTHPSDYDATDRTAPTYRDDASYFEDSNQYTVMSYFGEDETGADYGGKYASVPLIDDISAVQHLYGANMSTDAGDTVYGFNSNAGRDWYSATSSTTTLIFAVWDAGGNDTFDFSGYGQNQRIDLRAGDFSDVGGLQGNVSIAYGVTIENAIGGSGDDQIIGNAAHNVLDGGAGNDHLYGELGDDLLRGGSGNDTLDGGSGSDTVDGGGGDDLIIGPNGFGPAGSSLESDLYQGGAGADSIVGGVDNDHIYGNLMTSIVGSVDGADTLSGGAGNDYIQGNAGADSISGDAGNDRLYGGADDDVINGGAGYDYLQGNKGADLLSGGEDDDTLHGGADNDSLNGDAGNDQLFGDNGNDRLAGGPGIDQLTGGAGNDLFAFAPGDAAPVNGDAAQGTDRILDFQHGADQISLSFHVVAVLTGSAASISAAQSAAAMMLGAQAGQADVAAVSVASDTYLFFRADGSGGALDSAIDVQGQTAASFSTGDFAG